MDFHLFMTLGGCSSTSYHIHTPNSRKKEQLAGVGGNGTWQLSYRDFLGAATHYFWLIMHWSELNGAWEMLSFSQLDKVKIDATVGN